MTAKKLWKKTDLWTFNQCSCKWIPF